MNKAVLMIAHKGAKQINLLCEQLLYDANGRTDIYIHLDKKADAIRGEIIQHPNVKFIKNNRSVTWGDDSNVRMLVDCFKEIQSYERVYDYFQICTGQDMMIKSGLDDFIEENKGKIFIEIIKDDVYIKNSLLHKTPKFMQKDISGNKILHALEIIQVVLTRIGLYPRKKTKYDYENVDFWCSYNWSFMPWEVFLYIVDFINKNPDFLDIYMDARVPEDGFLGTIIMNSPYRQNVVFFDEKITLGIFKNRTSLRGNSLTYLKPMDGCHFPAITKEDIQMLEKSSAFLARKFDIDVDEKVIDYFYKKVTSHHI